MPTINTILKRICELQPLWSPDNTPAMQERGSLIRAELTEELRSRKDLLGSALGEFGDDFRVDASDGIGRKTEAPWARFSSERMSPTPRDGYYVVIHFAANGSAVFLTLGCGSTVWANGMLHHLPPAELEKRTALARTMILRRHPTLDPFLDQIDLGARAPLPKTFERATAIAKRIAFDDLDQVNLDPLLQQAGSFLRSVYIGQREGVDLTPADQAEAELAEVARPRKPRMGAMQGYGLSPKEKRAIENHAMALARKWFEERGYKVVDRSANEAYDLEASKDGDIIKVEVKGTTSLTPTAILMTRNEVELHRTERGNTALVIVSAIELARGEPISAAGGSIETLLRWDIDQWEQTPTAYRLERQG